MAVHPITTRIPQELVGAIEDAIPDMDQIDDLPVRETAKETPRPVQVPIDSYPGGFTEAD